MKFICLSLFGEMIKNCMNTSIIGRALEKGIISFEHIDIRDFSDDKHGRVDDYPYGGGAGMLLKPEPVYKACEHAKKKAAGTSRVIYMTPKGRVLDQQLARELSQEENLIILCGHYEGIDERALELEVTDEISIGDYILTGGELPALVLIDTVARLIPGVLNNSDSPDTESFQDGLLEYPQYTRPVEFMNMKVPEVLLSGHHENISRYRREQSLLCTKKNRPDLYEKLILTDEDKIFLGLKKPKAKRRRRRSNMESSIKQDVMKKFDELFGSDRKPDVYFAPGRVNLIGEHTDYNGGHVFPCALTIGTYAAVKKRDDRSLRFYSINMPDNGVIEASLDELVNKKENKWTNYPLGVIKAFIDAGFEINAGFDIVLCGNIPNSSGLSSSASVEVLTGYILKDMFKLDIELLNIALLCQKAENEFVGVNCGILDQFAIAMGRKDNAMFLNTGTMKYEYAPIKLDGMKIVVMNTKKKRGLADSKYNERRSECETALAELQKVTAIESLGNLNEEDFNKYSYAITNETNKKRAKHAVYENQRTIHAVEALKNNDIDAFGKLMIASHMSLKDDYEVTGIELDTIVDAALQQKGVIGARMTGAGFGGCAISIVREEAIEAMIENVDKIYTEKTGLKAEFYVVEIGSGPVKC